MDDERARLLPYLRDDEALQWTGRPDPSKHLARNDLFLIPFSLLWGGFAIFWEIAALREDAGVGFALFGLPFVALGLYLIGGRFVVKARKKRNTVYGLTERRALVAEGAGSLADSPLQHQPIDQSRSRDGKHLTVTFGRPVNGLSIGAVYANTGLDVVGRAQSLLAFFDVAEVEGLEAALRKARP